MPRAPPIPLAAIAALAAALAAGGCSASKPVDVVNGKTVAPINPANPGPWRPHALEWAVKARILAGNPGMACSEYTATAAACPLPNLYTSRAQTALTNAAITCP